MIYNWLDKIRRMGLDQSFLISQTSVYGENEEEEIEDEQCRKYERI